MTVMIVQAFQMVITQKICVETVMMTHQMIVQWIVLVFGVALHGLVTVAV